MVNNSDIYKNPSLLVSGVNVKRDTNHGKTFLAH